MLYDPNDPKSILAHRKLVEKEIAKRRKLACKAGIKIYCS